MDTKIDTDSVKKNMYTCNGKTIKQLKLEGKKKPTNKTKKTPICCCSLVSLKLSSHANATDKPSTRARDRHKTHKHLQQWY